MKQDIHKIEEQVIDATEALRSIRRLIATTTADSELATLVKCRDDIGTLHVNASALRVELSRALPVLTAFLEQTK